MQNGIRPVIRRRLRAVVAMAAAAGIIAAGAVVTNTEPAYAAPPASFNPFAMNGGFTVYAREDATLDNDETEGTIAVGDTATVSANGQYTLAHVIAGTGDYTLPTVDGDPTRLLVGSYSPASTGILAITSAGTSDPTLQGDLKLVQRESVFQPFQRGSWLRMNRDPLIPDLTPLIDATHQDYPANATPPSSAVGNSSIYTFNTGPTAVADYVEANQEANYADAASCLDDLADPGNDVGYPVGVAEDAGDRVVLEPLSPDQPNVVDYADIADASLLQLSTGPTPGAGNPLIIRVPAGLGTVSAARMDPQGAYSPYIMWDLSAETGAVTVNAAQGRIDGSIYAPEATLTVNAAPLDGQVLARNVILQGGEIHTFLFSGQLSCDNSEAGTFRARKALEGITAADLPAGTTFTLNYSAAIPDAEAVTGSLELPASGDWIDAGVSFPVGTVVSFQEVAPESVPGYTWGTPVITPPSIIIGADTTVDVTVANIATQITGTFTVSKSVVEVDPGDPAAPAVTGTVPVTWTATLDGTEIGTGTLAVDFDGTPVGPEGSFPLGTEISLTEDLSGIAAPPGFQWGSPVWMPGSTFTITDDTTVAVGLVNVLVEDSDERTVTVTKQVSGEGADPRFGYAISYNVDPVVPGEETRTTRDLTVGTPVALVDLETGTDTLRLAELLPTFDGAAVDAADWELPVFRVTQNGVTEEFRPGGFEGVVDLDQAIVDIPLAGTADVFIEVGNEVLTGTFELSKALEGITAEDLPDDTEFTVNWTATTPSGAVSTGTVRLPADGTAVSPVDAGGDALLFPYGTIIAFDEEPPGAVSGFVWTGASFDPAEVTIGDEAAATVSSTLTNTADEITGSFQVVKELVGIEPDELLFDSLTVAYIATLPGGGVQAGTIQVPTDGTPAAPVDAEGDVVQFPIGTSIRFAELPLPPDALPPGYQWATPVWHPSDGIVITVDRRVKLAVVTNTAVEYTRISFVKEVSGPAADRVPADEVFRGQWWLDNDATDDGAEGWAEFRAGEVLVSADFPVGSIVEVSEPTLPVVPGVVWGTPVWTSGGVPLTLDEPGRYLVPTNVTADTTISLELNNIANSSGGGDLPATGGGAIAPVVPIGAIALIMLGAALLVRRREGA
ncbi:DUF5979 domain-containing protein [Microbacterium sp. CFBP9034]|uniref:DUF5979 domain-containing protein n=1 Tax=Microbacterium sp. CFBP9034 TaxID=3096540 RepID=UPI002A69E875|nr:DUF5979 domain-containing protein [Microbacterium sp. CFBP9034]MDY0908205.1 DUF5979 domain-containing protein [Microbacterium sp. CFBP9034]